MKHLKRVLFALALALVAVAAVPALGAPDTVKPKVRAITGFVTIDATSYRMQIQETVTFLSQVRDAVKAGGYDVAGIRISTQPFPEYTRGLSRADALSVLRGINDLAATLRFAPNIGPAMLKDTDDTGPVDLLIDVLSQGPGDTSEAAIAPIVGDVATLAFKWNKPLAARLLPAPGKKAGEMTEFSGALSNAIIQPLPGSSRK